MENLEKLYLTSKSIEQCQPKQTKSSQKIEKLKQTKQKHNHC